MNKINGSTTEILLFKKICGERGKIMKKYLPEGKIFNSPENRYYLQSERTMAEAMAQGLILEGHAVLCDSEHNIIVELPFGKGIIPRSEGAIGIQEGKTKDIALLSRVNKTVCFKVTDIVHEKGEVICRLSRRLAQEEFIERYISTLTHHPPQRQIFQWSGHICCGKKL